MDITEGIEVKDGAVVFDCFTDGIASILRGFQAKQISVTTCGWIGEAKGSLVSATVEVDPQEAQCPRGFVLQLEVRDDGVRGTGATVRLAVPGGRDGCCHAIEGKDGSVHLSLNTGDVTITPL